MREADASGEFGRCGSRWVGWFRLNTKYQAEIHSVILFSVVEEAFTDTVLVDVLVDAAKVGMTAEVVAKDD